MHALPVALPIPRALTNPFRNRILGHIDHCSSGPEGHLPDSPVTNFYLLARQLQKNLPATGGWREYVALRKSCLVSAMQCNLSCLTCLWLWANKVPSVGTVLSSCTSPSETFPQVCCKFTSNCLQIQSAWKPKIWPFRAAGNYSVTEEGDDFHLSTGDHHEVQYKIRIQFQSNLQKHHQNKVRCLPNVQPQYEFSIPYLIVLFRNVLAWCHLKEPLHLNSLFSGKRKIKMTSKIYYSLLYRTLPLRTYFPIPFLKSLLLGNLRQQLSFNL